MIPSLISLWSLITFTRYSQAYVTVNQQATTTAKVFIKEFVNNYGWPTKILTDQGQTFNGKLFEALCKEAKNTQVENISLSPSGLMDSLRGSIVHL